MLLSNRVAIVTGGANGIGRAVVLKFAEEGCDVAIADISLKEANETLNEVKKKGGDGLVVECDITNSSQIRNMVDQVISKFGKIDILVNNAGTLLSVTGPSFDASIATISEEEWDKLVAINLKGAFLCSKEVVPHMKEKRYGKIVNLSSLGAINPPAVAPHYNAAKAGILGLTYDMACELGPFNITVNAIMPGPTRTTFYQQVTESKTDEEVDAFFNELGKISPLQRIGLPEDIANAILFLASDLSAYITGAVLPVSGGEPLKPARL